METPTSHTSKSTKNRNFEDGYHKNFISRTIISRPFEKKKNNNNNCRLINTTKKSYTNLVFLYIIKKLIYSNKFIVFVYFTFRLTLVTTVPASETRCFDSLSLSLCLTTYLPSFSLILAASIFHPCHTSTSADKRFGKALFSPSLFCLFLSLSLSYTILTLE